MGGRKVFGSEVLASADVNELLMDQTVPRFASASARNSQWPSPPDGAMSYLTDLARFEERRAGSWRPVAAGGITGKMWRTAGVGNTGATLTEYVTAMDASRVRGGFQYDDAADQLVLPFDGLYDLTWQLYVLGNTTSVGTFGVRRTRASTGNLNVAHKAFYKPLASADVQDQGFARDVPLKAADRLSVVLLFQSGPTQYFGSGEPTGMALTATWVAPLPAGTSAL